ncbi:MAG: hypothetical protein EAZ15_04130 [Sphingobacteriales bacterium]|nr:MAG: hypothetical protein EAZ15_04130 [Sphingobacteriales bacterium]
MQTKLYQPFKNFNFDNNHCFLTGEPVLNQIPLTVFPEWIINKYDLLQRPFKMLDESMVSYGDIKLPVSIITQNKITNLDEKLAQSLKNGYHSLIQLPQLDLFLWAGKIVYGIIFKELQAAIKQYNVTKSEFNMSQGLIHKFTALHQMLQAITSPITFDDFKPWSIFLCKVYNPENEFTYRDEINTLTFSLRMNDFGLIINLQDNGVNQQYHQQTWDKIAHKTLHPIQFEELCARVFYSAYLFNRLPEYHIMPTESHVFIEAMPLQGMKAKPIFDEWQNKVYGQVLENFWKRWGFLHLEIIKNPQHPLSFLFDEEEDFLPPETILLPN